MKNKLPTLKTAKRREARLRKISYIAIFVALGIFYFNLVFFSESPQIFGILNLVAGVVAMGIPVWTKYKDYNRGKNLEALFPAFLRDVTENIAVGMSLTQAIRTSSKSDYGKLTPYVKELSAKLDWGVTFERAFENFAEKTGSKLIRRTVRSIIEAHRSGGKISTVLESITVSTVELDRIKKERAYSVYSQMVTGYFIYILFLMIMFVLAKVLIPIFTNEDLFGVLGVEIDTVGIVRFYTEIFRNLTVIQGIFAGLGIGKMSEGTIMAGVKHAFVLSVIGYSLFII